MSQPLLSQKRFYLFFVAYWVAWVAVQTALLQWYGYSGSNYVWDSITTYALLALICLIVGNIFTYYRPSGDIIIYSCILAGLSTIVWGYTEKWLLETFIYKTDLQADWLTKSMPVRFWIGLLNIVWLMAVVYFWERIEEEKDVKERKNTLEKSVREAELYKLRQQLSPHFLFNSLNSINALIHSRPDEARRMVHQLSDFLRGTLKQEEDHFVTLKEELNYLKLYLDIEKVRFGHRLKVEFDTKEDSLDCKMPPMLLQPLLENAIKFGLYGTTGEAKIGLRARFIDHYLVVAIMNPYDPDMQMPEGTGFGLKSIRRRLYLLFGRDDLVEINQDKNVFVVIFRIPQFTVS